MNRIATRSLLFTALLAVTAASTASMLHTPEWTTPTAEELSMTSQPEVPGAAAVYLDREETTVDDLHDFTVYTRIKVLTEGGKKSGDVEIHYGTDRTGEGTTIQDIEARTIEPDGTIVPFTGKPYDKLVHKAHGAKEMEKVFSMPNVQVGSILEYRYQIGYNDNIVYAPQWYIQSDLFTRKAHYVWEPTLHELSGSRGEISSVLWLPILPAGTQVKRTTYPPAHYDQAGRTIYEVTVDNVPPAPDEEYMPPTRSLTYRVLFSYSVYRNVDEFWKGEGKRWSKEGDKFIGPGHAVRDAVAQITAPTDSQEQKLGKIYAAVMQLENTNFTRVHSTSEEKAEGLKEVHDTDDVWTRKRGDSDQLTELFVAMARAAGMKAYLFAVTNRDRDIFLKGYFSLSQLDDDIAIVDVNGTEQFFDPGSRYCPYGHLNWKHTMASGLRQTDKGTDFATAPMESYKTSEVDRIADLTMDPQGIASGTVKMTYTGAPALSWRQRSLAGDATSLNEELRSNVEKLLPQGMDVKVVGIENLTAYEQPLIVNYQIKGAIGSATGKRLFYPGDLFEANAKAAFPNAKRDIPVYFDYPSTTLDAVRVKFPSNFSVESSPANATYRYKDMAAYTEQTTPAPGSVTVHRDYVLANVLSFPKEYSDLRSFYSKIETQDQGSVVLETAAAQSNGAN